MNIRQAIINRYNNYRHILCRSAGFSPIDTEELKSASYYGDRMDKHAKQSVLVVGLEILDETINEIRAGALEPKPINSGMAISIIGDLNTKLMFQRQAIIELACRRVLQRDYHARNIALSINGFPQPDVVNDMYPVEAKKALVDVIRKEYHTLRTEIDRATT